MHHGSIICIHMKRKTPEKETVFACIFLCHKCAYSMNNSNNNVCLQTFAMLHSTASFPIHQHFSPHQNTAPPQALFAPREGCVVADQTLPAEPQSCGHCCPTRLWGCLLSPGDCVGTSSFPRL